MSSAGTKTDGRGYDGASSEAIRHHYDLGNDFFALWLDETLTYSCALWDEGDDDLEAAQLRKLDHLALGAGAAASHLVLDVGCGWGSMMRRLADVHGVAHVVGLTLSAAQAEFIVAEPDGRLEVRLENWADHRPSSTYDAIVSIGAFEHFATFGMPSEERIAAYARFFERCRDWLRPGGRLALQSIVKGANGRLDRQMTRELMFVIKKIFPESELPWPAEMLEASTRRLELVSMRNDALHYARTCAVWRDRLLARRREAEEMVGVETVADYLRYLQASTEAFDRGHVGLVRALFQRV